MVSTPVRDSVDSEGAEALSPVRVELTKNFSLLKHKQTIEKPRNMK